MNNIQLKRKYMGAIKDFKVGRIVKNRREEREILGVRSCKKRLWNDCGSYICGSFNFSIKQFPDSPEMTWFCYRNDGFWELKDE